VVAHIVQAQRRRVADELAEDAVTARQVADRLARLRIDPTGDEALQLAAVLVENADGGVAGAGQLAGDAQQLLEHGVDLELGDQTAARLQQRRKAGLVELPELHGEDSSIRGNPQRLRGTLRTTCGLLPPILKAANRKEAQMAAHVDEPTVQPASGAGLLPLFAVAVVVATIAICAVVAAPSTVTLIVALGSVIGFGAGIVALLGRLIGPDEH
jgi:hypothetical protein